MPSMKKSQVSHLQQTRAVQVAKSLQKYDHISTHHGNLNWLPISHQIMFKSVCAMFCYYHQGEGCLLLDPPIQYGW